MFNLPTVDNNGLKELDEPLDILTINEMSEQIRIYQPMLYIFITKFADSSDLDETSRAAITICCWYMLAGLSGQGKAEGESYYQIYNQLVDKWGISTPDELREINNASTIDEQYLKDGSFLISNLGEEKAMPIIEAASRSMQPDLFMCGVYYAINCMNTKLKSQKEKVSVN